MQYFFLPWFREVFLAGIRMTPAIEYTSGHSLGFRYDLLRQFERIVVSSQQRPAIVGFRLSDGKTNWTVEQNGNTWTLTTTHAGPGRPPSTLKRNAEVRKHYRALLPAVKDIKDAIKRLPENTGSPRRLKTLKAMSPASFIERMKSSSSLDRLSLAWLADIGISSDDYLSYGFSEKKTELDVLWLHFIAGKFQPSDLAEATLCVWHLLSRAVVHKAVTSRRGATRTKKVTKAS